MGFIHVGTYIVSGIYPISNCLRSILRLRDYLYFPRCCSRSIDSSEILCKINNHFEMCVCVGFCCCIYGIVNGLNWERIYIILMAVGIMCGWDFRIIRI